MLVRVDCEDKRAFKGRAYLARISVKDVAWMCSQKNYRVAIVEWNLDLR